MCSNFLVHIIRTWADAFDVCFNDKSSSSSAVNSNVLTDQLESPGRLAAGAFPVAETHA